MKKMSSLMLGLVMLSVTSIISHAQMKTSIPSGNSPLVLVAKRPSPSPSPLGVMPAAMFPPCQSPSGLVLLTMKTDDSKSEREDIPSSQPETYGAQPQGTQATLAVYPLTKDGPAQQPCVVRNAKSHMYEPTPGSLLSAFPLV